ncbi:hypothetical protein PPYR_14449 [Photinus pyralis]|uniref:Piwi domain-containing protein n=1 Tax=Photinus pyralis TaxID=7054 RepID=A0A1Y1KES2_PHOPY|nr:piwi-like protein Ago3 [Photinus pyralis]KAB0792490.1 hypothetical protein PPYR_14449 [Photinus pyralis]
MATINAFTLQTSDLFEYGVTFVPNLGSTAKESFLKRHFLKVGNVYFYQHDIVRTFAQLETKNMECVLYNRNMHCNVTMSLKLLRKRKIDIDLVKMCLKDVCELVPLPELPGDNPNVRIIPKFSYSIHESDSILLFIYCCYYQVQCENLRDAMSKYKKPHDDAFYHRAVEFFLKKTYIYNDLDDKVYRFKTINWETNSITLDPFFESAKLEHLHVAEERAYEEAPTDVRDNLNKLITNDNFGLAMAEVRVKTEALPLETIVFGDGVSYTCTNWKEHVCNNEVLSSVDLWCWVIMYETKDESFARNCVKIMQEIQEDTGIEIGNPLFLPIGGRTKTAYKTALSSIESKDLQLVVVVLNETCNNPRAFIKRMCFVENPVPCHIISSKNALGRDEIHRITLTINAKLGGSLWCVTLPRFIMICSIDTYVGFDDTSRPVCSFVCNLGDDTIQWYSKATFCKGDLIGHLKRCLIDIVHKYSEMNGYPPKEIIIYHSNNWLSTSEISTMYDGLHLDEIVFSVILVSSVPRVEIVKSEGKVLPGTVLNNVLNTNFVDFALMSSAANFEIPPATHYTILRRVKNTSLSFLQQLTYKLCYIYYKKMEVSDMPAPCIYARKLSKLVTEEIFDIPSCILDMYLYYI